MSESIRIVISGAAGRMGKALSSVIAERDDVSLVATLIRPGSELENRPTPTAGAPNYATRLPESVIADVLIDFSASSGFDAALELALTRNIAFVSGSTGLDPSQIEALDQAARRIPLMWAANFSVGVAVLEHLVGEAARLLPDWDCEIIESHHRHKLDAPSGTALTLGRRAGEARGVDAPDPDLDRNGRRDVGTIGYSVSRGGDIVGEHEVRLAGFGERVELIHRATDRAIFAKGALTAACWLSRQVPGRYSMADMLGL
ncbi:MAG TPA: 4-hydroxy-tetrahydrodipicolinate reductase [Dokdonella sp.]|uniref:4-hydroxy-tetrahydrodipicolinate reductase n=1 Tax=Dokdonella sp. TaxID=2291710 RepID=UPI002D7F28FE|nr:4-hydroxy-tetrahydrodipicolinate reductase [Dokdonella sp.]HET9032773.1 4-hydroxy-tetrahydrodipicolinate reductase [Dokdonella sp.]